MTVGIDVGTQARKARQDWSATVSVAALASEDACAPVKRHGVNQTLHNRFNCANRV